MQKWHTHSGDSQDTLARSVIATIICVFISSAAVSGGQTPPVFHTGVSLVHLDVEVTDAGGRIITGLSRADFRVFDEDAEQPVVAVAGEDQPLDVILLFDSSSSMRSVSEKVAAAGHDAFSTFRPGDRVAVMAFNTVSRLLTPLTSDLSSVEASLAFLSKDSFHGGTRIQEAVDNAATRFIWSSQDEQRRRAVLVITDNLGRPAKSEQAIIEDFWEQDTLLSALIIPKHKSAAALIMGREPGGVDRIVDETGGDLVRTSDVGNTFAELLQRLRLRYGLYYRLPQGAAGTFRRVRVALSPEAQTLHPGARILVRQHYRVRGKDKFGFGVRQ
jgi:VWFA-related protein